MTKNLNPTKWLEDHRATQMIMRDKELDDQPLKITKLDPRHSRQTVQRWKLTCRCRQYITAVDVQCRD